MPKATTAVHPDTLQSTREAGAILAVAVALLAALFLGAAAGVVPKSPTFVGQAPGQEYVSSQARGSALSLP